METQSPSISAGQRWRVVANYRATFFWPEPNGSGTGVFGVGDLLEVLSGELQPFFGRCLGAGEVGDYILVQALSGEHKSLSGLMLRSDFGRGQMVLVSHDLAVATKENT